MHTQKYQVALVAIILIVFSCSYSDSGDNVSDQPVSSDEFISYQLTADLPKAEWSEIIDQVEITRLEESEESLLSYVFNLHFVGDKIVFSNGDENSIYTFTKEGEFIQKFTKKGEGPEEYPSINDLWMEGDTVAIYSQGKFINRYLLKGDFISSESLRYQAGHILSYAKGYALDMFFETVDDSLFYNVITLDSELSRQETLLPSDPPKGFRIRTGNNTLMPYKSSFLYQRVMSDTVYIKTEDAMEPMIHFDFDKDWFWAENDVKDNVLDKMFQSDMVWNLTSKVTRKYAYVFGTVGQGPGKRYIIDRTTNKVLEIVENSLVEEEKYALRINDLTENGITGSISSLGVANLLNDLEEGQWVFTEGTSLEAIESSENPALIKVKFKDSMEW